VIFGQEGSQVITASDVARPSLAGVQQTLDDIIFERLVYMDAQKYKILSDNDAVDRYLAIVQKENNLTHEQLRDIFSVSGYTYEEGREQFRVLQTVNSMLDFKIRSHVIVPKKQVEAYDGMTKRSEPIIVLPVNADVTGLKVLHPIQILRDAMTR
jgi:hypothetical protein